MCHDPLPAAIREHPFVLPLLSTEGEQVFRAAVQRDLGAGDALIRVQDNELLFLYAGLVEVYYGGRFARFAVAHEVVGLCPELGALRGPITVRSHGARGFTLPRQPLMTLVTAHSEHFEAQRRRELEAFLRGHEALEENLRDRFGGPGALMIPGPYRAQGVTTVFCVMRAHAPEVLNRVLSQAGDSLLNLGNGLYLVVFCDYGRFISTHGWAGGEEFHFRETGLLVPGVDKQGSIAFFTPEIYPDSYLAIVVGREVYGFPKQRGRTLGGQPFMQHRALLLEVSGQVTMRMTWKQGHPVAREEFGRKVLDAVLGANISEILPHATRASLVPLLEAGLVTQQTLRKLLGVSFPEVPVYFRHRVPRATGPGGGQDVEYALDDLVRVPFTVQQGEAIHACHLLEGAQLQIHPGFWLQGTCEAAFAVTVNFEMGNRQLVHKHVSRRRLRLGLPSPATLQDGLLGHLPFVGRLKPNRDS